MKRVRGEGVGEPVAAWQGEETGVVSDGGGAAAGCDTGRESYASRGGKGRQGGSCHDTETGLRDEVEERQMPWAGEGGMKELRE